ncbi:MAG: DUF5687 family protein [Flavobacteriaceae bacterium]|nr:DUF5687 family protein [Flavobacteriaceae bacterium]
MKTKLFIDLLKKQFWRAPNFSVALVYKILMLIGFLYFAVAFTFLSLGISWYIGKELGEHPLRLANDFIIYYLVADLVIKYFFQPMPTLNLRPLMLTSIKRDDIIQFFLVKICLSWFNIIHLFLLVPFVVTAFVQFPGDWWAWLWLLSIIILLNINTLLNILINNKDVLLMVIAALIFASGAAQYYGYLNLGELTAPAFELIESAPYSTVLLLFMFWIIWRYAKAYFSKQLYLDAALKSKTTQASSYSFEGLNRFGSMGSFLKNDLRMIFRNKRPRNAALASFLFLFYGFILSLSSDKIIDPYNFMTLIFATFITGGFMFMFGQYVPSWDSRHYPLMMSQNITYREYLLSKWYLMNVANVVLVLLAVFYAFFSWKYYVILIGAALYNIGINSVLVLIGGAYNKVPIDLTKTKSAFGGTNSFNFRAILLMIPQLIVPGMIFFFTLKLEILWVGVLAVSSLGILGILYRNKAFDWLEKLFKKEKYKALAAYKK